MIRPDLKSVSLYFKKNSGMGKRKLCFQETFVSFFVSLVFIFHRGVICQDDSSLDNPAANRLYNQFVFDKISNLTEVFEDDIKRELGFCITNVLVNILSLFFSLSKKKKTNKPMKKKKKILCVAEKKIIMKRLTSLPSQAS